MVTTSKSSYSRGVTEKQVVIESIDAIKNECVVKDRTGMRHKVSLKVQRVGIAPSVHEVWMVDKQWGNWTLSGRLSGGEIGGEVGEGHSHGRQSSTYTTDDLDAGSVEMGLIDLSPHYAVLHIATSVPARVRLYCTATDQTEDLSRGPTTEPAAGLGIVLDYLTADVLLSAPLTPVPHGVSFSVPPSAQTPISVTSVNGGPVTVTLTWVSEE